MVGGLVEQEQRGSAEERLREQDADLLAALDFAHQALVERVFDAEAIEQGGGVALGGIAALFADDAFEFAEAHAVFIGELVVRLGVEDVALGEGLPQGHVAHDHGIDDAVLIEGKLVLAQDAEFLGARDGSLGRLDIAGEDLHQGGLAGAVGAGDRVTTARQERAGDVFEQSSGAEAHGDIVNGEQSYLP